MKWFVTGTDTGVGKTTVACAILRASRALGACVAGIKPIESGCRRNEQTGELVPDDARRLAVASADPGLEQHCLYRFDLAAAPGVCAEASGERIDFERIAETLATVDSGGRDLVMIEGAGGILVPLGGGRTVADLARSVGAPLLIVSRGTLGTINHTVLTVEAARARGLDVAAFAFSSTHRTETSSVETNAAQIVSMTGARFLGLLPHQVDIDNPLLGTLDLATIMGPLRTRRPT